MMVEMTEANTIDYRVATRDDETDILAVLEEVAPEIPVSLDTPEAKNIIKGIIIECRQSGKSWVAVDAAGTVVGFVLARKDIHEQQAISLRYIGVSGNSRRRGIFATLIEKMKANGTPLTASVLAGNKSGMVDRLVKTGFTKQGPDAKETKLRWTPVVEASKSAATSRT
ncbi:MAG TPA: GNAT family N-acetyltransferase [Xanthobacteraceae bacterium]|jgi:N-acetylglutamate synthase-like GNAT family acetyltransferase